MTSVTLSCLGACMSLHLRVAQCQAAGVLAVIVCNTLEGEPVNMTSDPGDRGRACEHDLCSGDRGRAREHDL